MNVRKKIGIAMAPGASLAVDVQSTKTMNSDILISMAWAAKVCPEDPDLACRALRVKWGLSEREEPYLLAATARMVQRAFRKQPWTVEPVGLLFAGQLVTEFLADSCRNCDGEGRLWIDDPDIPGWKDIIDCPECRGTAKCTTSDRAREKALKISHATYRRNVDTWTFRFDRARKILNEIERKTISRMKYALLG